MKNLLINILLAFIWAAVSGAFTIANFVVGFILAYVVLRILQPLLGNAGYDRRLWEQMRLIVFFFYELVSSSIRVAVEVLTPSFSMHAGIIAIPLEVQSDLGIMMLANLISLTPGTLSLDVSDDRKYLYIHAMYVDEDLEFEKTALKKTTEKRVIKALGEAAFDSSLGRERAPEPVA